MSIESHTVVDCSVAPRMDAAHVRKMRASCVDIYNWTACDPTASWDTANRQLGDARRLAETTRGLSLVKSMEDVGEVCDKGWIGVIFGPQNSQLLDADLRRLPALYEMGVRILQLTYNEQNDAGYGCLAGNDQGLTQFGHTLVREINEIGMVLDLAHAGPRTALEAIEASTHPPIISHANARVVHNSIRNFPDDVLTALRDAGGVIGATLWSPMVGALEERQPTLPDFLRHVEYMFELLGVDAVGLGSDHSENTPRDQWNALFSSTGKYREVAQSEGPWYNYDTRFVADASSCTQLESVFQGVEGLGLLDEDQMAGFVGGNFLRAFDQAWSS